MRDRTQILLLLLIGAFIAPVISTRHPSTPAIPGDTGAFVEFPMATFDRPSGTKAVAWEARPSPTGSAEQISKMVAAQEWLGPVSAIALSPFFGLACLSGIATYGPEWLHNSALLGSGSPLNSPALFWVMALLTIATSLPRWTKFSKPISLALEKVEAYSAVIILIAMRLTLSGNGALVEPVAWSNPLDPVHAGIVTLPFEIFMAIAMAINMIVVNTIKLLLDVLIWLIPIPAVDAALEIASKLTSATLLGFYAANPTLATIINLTIFAICGLLFFQARRRLVYFKEILVRPVLERFFGSKQTIGSHWDVVFLSSPWNGFPVWTQGTLTHAPGRKAPELVFRGWFSELRVTIHPSGSPPEPGLLSDTIHFGTERGPVRLTARKGVFVKDDLDREPTAPLLS
jgi:hypothetical protein